MNDAEKTREQLIGEISTLRKRISAMEESEAALKKAEKELRNSEERFRILFEYAPDAYCMSGVDGTFIDGNKVLEEMIGCKKEELIGRNFLQLGLLPLHQIPRAAFLLAKNSMGICAGPDDFTLTRKDGKKVVLEIMTFPVRIKDQAVVLCIARDVSNRKRAEEEMRQDCERLESLVKERTAEIAASNEKLRQEIEERKQVEEKYKKLSQEFQAILDAIPDNLTLQSREFALIWSNKGAARGLGREVSEIMGKKCYELWHGRSEPCPACPVERSFQTGMPTHEQVITPDKRTWELRTVPVKDENGATTAVVEMGRDISDQILANEVLRVSLREKETLLQELFHRTKNNMQIIASLLNLQSATCTDEELLRIIKETQNRIKSIALVHEKLYQSKDLSNINLRDYVHDLVNALFHSYHVQDKRISLHTDVNNIAVNVDTAVPCGIIINELITNILKHAFPDGRSGEMKITMHLADEGEFKLIVSDDGVGLPEDFESRISKTLGLKLVHQLVENQLGGNVQIRTGKGTEFVATFKERSPENI